MIVLAIDTALSALSVAVIDGETVLAARSEHLERGHSERLAGLVRDIMAEAGVPFSALGRVGVVVGPGSFTGLRVGLAFAKGLALALAIPCVGVGSLEALAAGASASGVVVAAIDARRGQLYLQVFEHGAPLTEPEVLSIEAARDRLAQFGGDQAMVGSGAALLRFGDTLIPSATLINVYDTVDPVILASLALHASEPIARPAPLYLRPPDARTIAERAVSR